MTIRSFVQSFFHVFSFLLPRQGQFISYVDIVGLDHFSRNVLNFVFVQLNELHRDLLSNSIRLRNHPPHESSYIRPFHGASSGTTSNGMYPRLWLSVWHGTHNPWTFSHRFVLRVKKNTFSLEAVSDRIEQHVSLATLDSRCFLATIPLQIGFIWLSQPWKTLQRP